MASETGLPTLERWRVPVRIDLAGGTLDLWPIYAMLEGCITVNAAVDLWVEIEASAGGEASIQSADLKCSFPSEPWPVRPPEGLSWIWRVLSDAVNKPRFLRLRCPVPKGSGLGVSSCMGVGLVGVAAGIEAGEELAGCVPRLRDLEAMELQTPTGWQDYYPAALGGAVALHWDRPLPRWERLHPHPSLMERLVVFYTGAPHHSGLTNWEAYKRFIEGDGTTRAALREIRDIAIEMAAAVPSDAHAVAELLEREGQARMKLSPAVETDAMRAVRDRGHRDGWFEAANDNGTGVATMLGLAEYFAKMPQAQRKRTIVFLGTTGHHDGTAESGTWLSQHKEVFAKTALIINCEHTAANLLIASNGSVVNKAAVESPLAWYIGGSAALEKIVTGAYDTFGVKLMERRSANAAGEIGRIQNLAPSMQLIDTGLYWHSDHETPDIIPSSGLAAVTRAYAKIIADIDMVPLKDLQRP